MPLPSLSNKTNMNEKEALLLIEDMISSTKNDIKESGFYYYFWGWLVFIAAVSNLLILQFNWLEVHALPWIILMPLGGLVTFIAGRTKAQNQPKVKTYVGQSMYATMVAFAVSLFVVCFAMTAGEQWKAFYPTIMVVYAIWLFISGKLLQYKPLVWGGYLNWLLAVCGYLWPSTIVHLYLISAGVLGGFIIPGHLLTKRVQQRV